LRNHDEVWVAAAGELVVVSPYSKKGYQSPGGDTRNYNNSYDEGDILRLMAQGLACPRPILLGYQWMPMADFFSTEVIRFYETSTEASRAPNTARAQEVKQQ